MISVAVVEPLESMILPICAPRPAIGAFDSCFGLVSARPRALLALETAPRPAIAGVAPKVAPATPDPTFLKFLSKASNCSSSSPSAGMDAERCVHVLVGEVAAQGRSRRPVRQRDDVSEPVGVIEERGAVCLHHRHMLVDRCAWHEPAQQRPCPRVLGDLHVAGMHPGLRRHALDFL